MKNSQIIESMKDLDATLVAIDLALEVLQQPLAVYDCSDAELDASVTQFKMLKVAYMLIKRRAGKSVSIPVRCDRNCQCPECSEARRTA